MSCSCCSRPGSRSYDPESPGNRGDGPSRVGLVILLPLALDVFDRRIVDPGAPRTPALQSGWWGSLVLAPVVFSVLNRTLDDGGVVDKVDRYGVRPQEAFVAVQILGLYFALLDTRWVRGNAKT